MSPIVIALIGLLVWILISVGLGFLMGLAGSMLYIFIGILSIVGIIGAGVYIWLARKTNTGAANSSSGDAEIDALVKDVDAKLAVARTVQGARVSSLPLVFVLGENGSVKTTSVIHSNLEPELVSGQVYQDTNILPTPLANFFLARQTLFVDTAGGFTNDGARWQRLVRRLAPGQLKNVMGAGTQSPRGALVCVDVEMFFRQGGTEAASVSARKLNERLVEISAQLGIRVPVYVLFTRMDRVQFFHDFVRNISNEESLQVFGATVPIRPADSGGIYSDEENRRLTEQFNLLTHSLCDKRVLYLPRETDPAKLPGAYEFAREFSKLRRPLVQFLVDLCKPSQLRTSPFLRGFYFSGVRPVVVDDSAGLQAARQQHQSAIEQGPAGATKIFKLGPGGLMAQNQPQLTPTVGATKKVPQWTFLGRLFNDIVLGDAEAQAASSSSTRTSMAQRVLLGVAAAIALFAAAGFTISYLGNRSLENGALEAARGISAVNVTDANALPETASLEKLETLRQTLETLDNYKVNGAPLGLRWGLYSGNEMYPHVKELWCQKFNQTLLGPTVNTMQTRLKGLPAAPQPTDDYGTYFNMLRTYLTVTAYPEKSTREITGAALLNAWSFGRNVGDRSVLAKLQFDYYGDYLRTGGGCPLPFDPDAATRGRRFLGQFSGVDSIYQAMLAAANKATKPVNFNRDIRGSETVIVNNKDVAGAFTREGFDTMNKYFGNPKEFFGGDRWVLCGEESNPKDTARTSCDINTSVPPDLVKQLTDRYAVDFIRAWRTYVRNTTFVRYADLEDATKKLEQLSNNDTPLMALFWLATRNTAVTNDKIRNAFQPLHEVVPPPASIQKYIYAEKNGNYIDSLARLQKALADAVPTLKTDPNAANKPIDSAGDARMQVKSVSRNFNPDPEGQVDQLSARILEDPIVQVDRFLRGMGKDELNAKGAGFCNARFAGLRSKFPFNPAAKVDAALDDVVKVFRPGDGALWDFYKTDLTKYLKKNPQTGVWEGVNEGNIQINPAFLRFFNQAAKFSEMAFPGNAQQPQMVYTLTPVKSDVVTGTTLTIDGQTANLGASGGGKQFTWPGSPSGALVKVKVVGGTELTADQQEGLWAVYRFIHNADRVTSSGNGQVIEWVQRQGRDNKAVMIGDKELRYKFEVNVPIFTKEFYQSLQCVPQVAR